MDKTEKYTVAAVGEGGEVTSSIRCQELLDAALLELRKAKPEDRSIWARRYAVTITELEKLIAYFVYWVVLEEEALDGNPD